MKNKINLLENNTYILNNKTKEMIDSLEENISTKNYEHEYVNVNKEKLTCRNATQSLHGNINEQGTLSMITDFYISFGTKDNLEFHKSVIAKVSPLTQQVGTLFMMFSTYNSKSLEKEVTQLVEDIIVANKFIFNSNKEVPLNLYIYQEVISGLNSIKDSLIMIAYGKKPIK